MKLFSSSLKIDILTKDILDFLLGFWFQVESSALLQYLFYCEIQGVGDYWSQSKTNKSSLPFQICPS